MSASQCTRILAHMRRWKRITPAQAYERYGCLRLAARIADLKAEGFKIGTEIIHDKRTGKRYASYHLHP